MTKRKTLKDYGGMDAIYRDQAPYHSHYGERCFFAAYTPWGISVKDTGYARRIMDFQGGEEERKQLEEEIAKDPHLHRFIKKNLIENLRDKPK